MKRNYTISEIKKIYGFGLDSLRYYEKIGLMQPRRGENGYRIYDLDSIYKLNIIKDLRELGFPFSKIKDFLLKRSLSSSVAFLKEEEEAAENRIRSLQKKKKSLLSKIAYIEQYSKAEGGTLKTEYKAKRGCLSLRTDIPFGHGLDLLFNEVTDLDDNYLSLIGNDTYGGILSPSFDSYTRVFLLSPEIKKPNFLLKEGFYSSLFYLGSYAKRKEALTLFLKKISQEGLVPIGPVLELFHLDNHETKDEKEYVTEFTAEVRKKEEGQ